MYGIAAFTSIGMMFLFRWVACRINGNTYIASTLQEANNDLEETRKNIGLIVN